MATREEILKEISDLRKRKKELKNPNRKTSVDLRIDLLERRLKGKKLNVDTSDVTLPKSKTGVSRLRMRKEAEKKAAEKKAAEKKAAKKPVPKKLNVKTSDVTLPRSKTGVSRLLSTAMKKAADRDKLIPKGAVRKKPVKRKKATVAPAMMFDANLQQTTPDVGAASQQASPKPAAKISSGGRGKSRGSMGGESISEYFEDLGQRKTKVRTPFGLITVDSTDEGMAFEEFDQKYGGKAMPKVKNRKGKRAAIRGRRAEMKGS
tara:strand:+ start:1363 stop:2148 length:786 start_codon:yes stop_codon:yes gene_type:complete